MVTRMSLVILCVLAILDTCGCGDKQWDEAAIQREINANLRVEDAVAVTAPASKFSDEWHPPQIALKSNAPAPTVKRGPKMKLGGKLVPTYYVGQQNGVGTDPGDLTCKGVFVQSGLSPDGVNPAFTNGDKWLWFLTGPDDNGWVLSAAVGDSTTFATTAYSNPTAGATPDDGTWYAAAGTAPAPTVAEAVINPFAWYWWDDAPYVPPPSSIAPCRAALGGNDYIVFPYSLLSATNPGGFFLFREDTQAWSEFNFPAALLPLGDDFQTGAVFDAGDGTHVWLTGGAVDDDGIPCMVWQKWAITPGTSATKISEATLPLPGLDLSNPLWHGDGTVRFVLRYGGNTELCSYTPGATTYTVVYSYLTGTGLPTGYTAAELATDRTDQSLFVRDATTYWLRRATDGSETRLVPYTLGATCTRLSDLLVIHDRDDGIPPAGDHLLQAWGNFSGAARVDCGYGADTDTALVWVPGNDGVETATWANTRATRRWYIDGTQPLYVGWGLEQFEYLPFVSLPPPLGGTAGAATAIASGLSATATLAPLSATAAIATATAAGLQATAANAPLSATAGIATATATGLTAEGHIGQTAVAQAASATAEGLDANAKLVTVFERSHSVIEWYMVRYKRGVA